MSINKFKPNLDPQLVNRTIVTHRQWAKQRLADRVVVQAGKWGHHGGMIIVRAESREQADRIVNEDPLVQADLITFETGVLHASVPFTQTAKDT